MLLTGNMKPESSIVGMNNRKLTMKASPARILAFSGLALLGGFYLVLIGGLAVLVVLVGTTGRMGPKVSRALLGVSAVALLGLGGYNVWMGVAGLVG